MSFLQPWLLFALPLIALPVIIHLINQRRFQTIPWAAMMFLMAARRMARGYSRLRQWLILAFRVLAVTGLIMAVSRPLASGWLGLAAGGKADTTIVLLDRSPSMQERAAGTGESKLQTGRQQLAQVLRTIGSNHWVLIDGATREPRELESPAAFLDLPSAGPASSPSDLPLMLQAAHDYIRNHRTGRTDVWICSDLRENDWTAESGQWSSLRDAFLEFPQGVRFQLLAYPQAAANNVSIRVTGVRRQATSDGAELLVSLKLARSTGEEKVELPVQFEIEGARSVLNVALTGAQTEVRDHRIPIERSQQRGWGRVSIPADSNPADDEFFFVFDDPPPRRTLIIADDPQPQRLLELAASISPDDSIVCSAETLTIDQLSAANWDQVSLVLWQSPLPTGTAAELLEAFVERGGQVVFFPPPEPGSAELFGIRWQQWIDGDNTTVETWRGDADLLARTQSGAALPVGQLEVHRYCELSGEVTQLATLRGGAPLLARVPTDRGGVYVWATTPLPRDSSLATGGVVFYAFVQRALGAGSAGLGKARQLDAGDPDGESPDVWQRQSQAAEGLSTEAAFQAGVYGAEDRLLAVNRPALEDNSKTLADSRVAELFRGLDFTRVDDQAGSASALVQEIWRMFLMGMLAALVLEAVLCVPKSSGSKAA